MKTNLFSEIYRKSGHFFVKKTMGEVEFTDAGGLNGYVARASALLKKRRTEEAIE